MSLVLEIWNNVSSLRNLEFDEPFKLFDPPEPKPMRQEEAASNMVDSGHNSAQLSAIPFHAANSKTETHSVVNTATHLTGVPEIYDTASLMKDATKDMPADFGLQKWTGDAVEQDTKYAQATSNPQIVNEVDASQSSDNSRTEWTRKFLLGVCRTNDLLRRETSHSAYGKRSHSPGKKYGKTAGRKVELLNPE